MGHVNVHGANLDDDRIQQLRVKIPNLPPRTIDRDTAIAWMRDGHSLIPVLDGAELPRLHLAEIEQDGERTFFVRSDTTAMAADKLPDLPPVEEARA